MIHFLSLCNIYWGSNSAMLLKREIILFIDYYCVVSNHIRNIPFIQICLFTTMSDRGEFSLANVLVIVAFELSIYLKKCYWCNSSHLVWNEGRHLAETKYFQPVHKSISLGKISTRVAIHSYYKNLPSSFKEIGPQKSFPTMCTQTLISSGCCICPYCTSVVRVFKR